MADFTRRDRTISLNPIPIMVASLAGFASTAHRAYVCSTIYDELSVLDDESLGRCGVARHDLPRIAASATGLLPSGHDRDQTTDHDAADGDHRDWRH